RSRPASRSPIRRRTARRTRPRARCAARAPPIAAASLDEAGVRQRLQVGDLLDAADLQQQLGRLLAERLQHAGEETLVRRAVLPAQVGLRFLEGLAALLD